MKTETHQNTSAGEPRFAVLLATFNGARHLPEQLASLAAQTVARIDILASDDGSTDATRDMLSAEASRWHKGGFEIVSGPRAGFAENFRSLILSADADADYIAYCDQDDIWDADKLETARSALAGLSASTPALYCGATRTMSEDGRQMGISRTMSRPPGFRNALVQSIAGGNTMVMNRTALRLLQAASDEVRFVSHDWWTYLVVSGADGIVIYDPVPRISYRQHGENLIGANVGFIARLQRIRLLIGGRWFVWIETNLAALQAKRELLTEVNRHVVDEFCLHRRQAGPLRRLYSLNRLRLYRQTMAGTVSMALAVLLGKF